MNSEANMRICSTSFRTDIKEIHKNVKQCHSLEDVVIVIKMLFMLMRKEFIIAMLNELMNILHVCFNF